MANCTRTARPASEDDRACSRWACAVAALGRVAAFGRVAADAQVGELVGDGRGQDPPRELRGPTGDALASTPRCRPLNRHRRRARGGPLAPRRRRPSDTHGDRPRDREFASSITIANRNTDCTTLANSGDRNPYGITNRTGGDRNTDSTTLSTAGDPNAGGITNSTEAATSARLPARRDRSVATGRGVPGSR